MEEKYKDIINLPHHVSKKRPQMSLDARSAQFAPFAALTGYSDAIKETARLTNKRIELSDELKEALNMKLTVINNHLNEKPEINITYFVPDQRKQGGEYRELLANIKRIDIPNGYLYTTSRMCISIADIILLEGEIVNNIGY